MGKSAQGLYEFSADVLNETFHQWYSGNLSKKFGRRSYGSSAQGTQEYSAERRGEYSTVGQQVIGPRAGGINHFSAEG